MTFFTIFYYPIGTTPNLQVNIYFYMPFATAKIQRSVLEKHRDTVTLLPLGFLLGWGLGWGRFQKMKASVEDFTVAQKVGSCSTLNCRDSLWSTVERVRQVF